MSKKSLFVISFLFIALLHKGNAQTKPDVVDFINREHQWVDSVFKRLSKKERIAQLFLVRTHTNLGQEYIDSVAKVLRKEKLGGIVVFQGGPVRTAQMINRYQEAAKVPLLVAIDGEWGLGMRFPDSTISYPYQMALGAIQDDHLLYTMGQQVAKDFLRLGINFNFAPVVDVNNNPNNPVINFRSFGEDAPNVARKGEAYMLGMVNGGLLTTLKHFPGHGDTDVDSHHDLPVLPFSKQRLDSLEMYPFKQMIYAGTPGIMVAHMNIPSLDSTEHLPSSLSKSIISDLLKMDLGFRGLAVTDAMNMKGVVKFFPDGEADVLAFIAGNDLLELSENSKRAIKMVEKAIKKKRLDRDDLDRRVKKVLAAKYWLGLQQPTPVDTLGLYQALNSDSAKALVQQLADASMTMLRGDADSLNTSLRTAIISIGVDTTPVFQQELKATYPQADMIYVRPEADIEEINEGLRLVAAGNYEQLIVSIHDQRLRPQSKLNYSEALNRLISELDQQNSFFTLFGNPYALSSIPSLTDAKGLLVTYQNDAHMQKAAAKVIAGQLKATGKLPVSVAGY
ncbi:glycoside hydrolase family 3 protein [Olivibacter sitiensis]|uniref:glycoside hydrolase family 3 protein n=1 Tax=Olivibacter sitiensis TaxID=376470 RepID=UPI0003F8F924|nr:glycoside hydrolase family 3 N-terminal domain-containing protein [Olivibacter sitiensis]